VFKIEWKTVRVPKRGEPRPAQQKKGPSECGSVKNKRRNSGGNQICHRGAYRGESPAKKEGTGKKKEERSGRGPTVKAPFRKL